MIVKVIHHSWLILCWEVVIGGKAGGGLVARSCKEVPLAWWRERGRVGLRGEVGLEWAMFIYKGRCIYIWWRERERDREFWG